MRRLILAAGAWFLVAALVFLGSETAGAQDGGGTPAPHQAISEYTGPETCSTCHLSASREVVNSLHYQHQGPVPYRDGWDEEVLGGMYVTY